MAGWSPTLEGFRTMLRRPSLSLAEVIWRFSFGAAASVLLGLATIAYLDTLPVTGGDLWMLRTGHPVFAAQAIAHIFHGTALRVVIVTVIMISALAILWIVFASVGRVATLGPLLSYIRERAHQIASAYDPAAPATDSLPGASTRSHLRSLAGLHFLRVALGMAACASCVGAMILARSVSSQSRSALRPCLPYIRVPGVLDLGAVVFPELVSRSRTHLRGARGPRHFRRAAGHRDTLSKSPRPVHRRRQLVRIDSPDSAHRRQHGRGIPAGFRRCHPTGYRSRRSPSSNASLLRASRRALHRAASRLRRDSRSAATTSACPATINSDHSRARRSPDHRAQLRHGRSN